MNRDDVRNVAVEEVEGGLKVGCVFGALVVLVAFMIASAVWKELDLRLRAVESKVEQMERR